MFQITTVVQAMRRSLPFKGDDHPASDGDPPQPPSTVPPGPSEVFLELGIHPEELVVQLCRRSGGRMKQQTVVEQTGWSKSTVSRLLSDMEDDGHIVRTPLGREKVVALPGRLPETSRADSNTA